MGQRQSCCYALCCSQLDAFVDDNSEDVSPSATTNNYAAASSICNNSGNLNSSGGSSVSANINNKSCLKRNSRSGVEATTVALRVEEPSTPAGVDSSASPAAIRASATAAASARKKSLRRCSSLADKQLFGDLPEGLSQTAMGEILLLRGMVRSGLLPLHSYVQFAAEITECDQLKLQQEQQQKRQMQQQQQQQKLLQLQKQHPQQLQQQQQRQSRFMRAKAMARANNANF